MTTKIINNHNKLTKLAILYCAGLGSGFSKKAPGTVGTIAAMLLAAIFLQLEIYLNLFYLLFSLFILASGAVSINYLFKKGAISEKDPQFIVIDEWAGYFLAFSISKISYEGLLISFFLFRIFDILKPFGIKEVEKLDQGLGIMLDDYLAGFYAGLVSLFIMNYLF